MEGDNKKINVAELVEHFKNVTEAIESFSAAFVYGHKLFQELFNDTEFLEELRRLEIREKELKILRIKKYTLGLTWSEDRRLQRQS